SADVQLVFHAVKVGMHMLNLSAETAAIVVLNAPAEIIVELPCFGPNVFVVRPDTSVGAIGPHFTTDMIQHSIEMIDLAPKPGNGIPILLAVVVPMVVTAGVVNCFVGAPRINARLGGLFGLMCRGGE